VSHWLAGFLAPGVIYAGVLALHLLLPARRVEGYVRDERRSEPLRYRLNGLLVLLVTLALWAGAGATRFLPWDWLWQQRWPGLAGAATLGLIFSLAIVLTAPPTGASFWSDLFLGRRLNPQGFGGRADTKMFLYLAGATLLELNVLSFAAHHWMAFPGDPSPGVALYVGLFSFFVCEYLLFERVHLYTYDLFAERVGFKLGWGCLAFYPYFYPVGLWATADRPDPGTPGWALVGSALVFFAGWTLARGANMQKYAFKRDPERVFLGVFEPECVRDERHALLCSGFWAVSRHVNYLGEVLMASGLALSLGYPFAIGPWLYPLYYVLLLGARERDDDRRCAAKYGELWHTYRQRVPYRIVPGIY
jgi:protein-S-isoprenylcysteine O-methyltransferase Ste14